MAKTTFSRKNLPRGIRNNNPLNIRIGNVWLGEVETNTDGEFEQFVSMKYGLRAAMVILRRYIHHYKFNTVNQIISRWAPSTENNTVRYIDYVAQRCDIKPDAIIDFSQKDIICNLVAAMCQYENGGEVDFDIIQQAYTMA